VRPFVLLASRAEDAAADEEYAALLRVTGLAERELRRVRMEAAPMPPLDLDGVAGIIVGGGPFCSSDPEEEKSAVQRRVEAELRGLLDVVVTRDLPFFGACYGVGPLVLHQGGVVDQTHAEPVSATTIRLTPEGAADPVLAGVPEVFDAFVGHKEACRVLPPTAVLLASSPACPVQMFRVGRNAYATQFHPELDVEGVITRVRVYQDAGYFPPAELEALVAQLAAAVVTEPARMLANFVARYA
jgi:GMP synthase (glutamine-hydrolysing)